MKLRFFFMFKTFAFILFERHTELPFVISQAQVTSSSQNWSQIVASRLELNLGLPHELWEPKYCASWVHTGMNQALQYKMWVPQGVS